MPPPFMGEGLNGINQRFLKLTPLGFVWSAYTKTQWPLVYH